MIEDVYPRDELRGLATRKARPHDYKSVRRDETEEWTAKGWEPVKRSKGRIRLRKVKPLDRALEDRVWTLLWRMGFKFLSGERGAKLASLPDDEKAPVNQMDVVGIDDEIALVVECKSSGKTRRFNDFTADLQKHVSLRDNFNRAVAANFPIGHKRHTLFAIWTCGMQATESDRERARQEKVQVFSESDLEYYESLTNAIGEAARYQFLAEILQGRQVHGLTLRVPAIRTKVGGTIAYTFSVTPEYLLKVAFVSHHARGAQTDLGAYQRMLAKSRLKSIAQYISNGGYFPTNIVINIAEKKWLTFDRARQEEDQDEGSIYGWLNIRPAYRVAWVIDGQHRLFAYAGHELARKSVVSVMAFVGLPADDQAKLFVDINAKQKSVKRSLLQELYEDLHSNSDDPEERVQYIRSRIIRSLDQNQDSPFLGRIQKADDKRTDLRCISFTSLFQALGKPRFFIAKTKSGVPQYGPLWAVDNEATIRRTVSILTSYFGEIRNAASSLWDKGRGDGGGLAMNEGVTICVNVLRSTFDHLQITKGLDLTNLPIDELIDVLTPYSKIVGEHFGQMDKQQVKTLRQLRGVEGQTTGTRDLEAYIQTKYPDFNPPGLEDYLKRKKSETSDRADKLIKKIEVALKDSVLGKLKETFGSDETGWWYRGVPIEVRKKVSGRVEEESGMSGGKEENFDLIHYREIILEHWDVFGQKFGRGKGGKKDQTKWIVEVNQIRNRVAHPSKGIKLPPAENEVNFLEEIDIWLAGSGLDSTREG